MSTRFLTIADVAEQLRDRAAELARLAQEDV